MTQEALSRFFDVKQAAASTEAGAAAASSVPSTPENSSTRVGSPAPLETVLETLEVQSRAQESDLMSEQEEAKKTESNLVANTIRLVDILKEGDVKSDRFEAMARVVASDAAAVPSLEKAFQAMWQESEAKQAELRPAQQDAKADNLDRDLKESIQKGFVDPRSGLGQRFAAQHKAGSPQGDQYRSLSRAAAQAYRVKWAQTMYEQRRESKQYCQRWRRIDVTKGKYKPLPKIVEDQGGGAEGFIAALRIACMCCTMGGDWVRVHPQSQRVLFLEVEFSWREEFEEAYSMCSEEYTMGNRQTGARAKLAAEPVQSGGAPVTVVISL